MSDPLRVARRIQSVQPSVTLSVDRKAKEAQARGEDIIGFGVGEPDFNTPEHVIQAGVRAMTGGDTRYAAKRGLELKKAICAKLQRENGLAYAPDQVLISNGAKHTLYNLIQVAVDEGDEVILPAPYWVSYLEMIRLARGTPVVIDTDESSGFRITPEQLRKAITPRTRMLILNSPSNPTGATYPPEETRALAKVIEEHGLLTISDEVYEHFVYGNFKPLSLAACSPRLLKELVLTVNALSKTFAMTGWRVGYVAGPKAIVDKAATLQSHATSDPAAFSQAGAAEALVAQAASELSVKTMREEFEKRRALMLARLNALPGVKCFEPEGAFYCFPNISGLFGRKVGGKLITCSLDFVEVCLEQAKVALVPGEAFGSARHIRLSYATSREKIVKGLDRIEQLLRSGA